MQYSKKVGKYKIYKNIMNYVHKFDKNSTISFVRQ